MKARRKTLKTFVPSTSRNVASGQLFTVLPILSGFPRNFERIFEQACLNYTPCVTLTLSSTNESLVRHVACG